MPNACPSSNEFALTLVLQGFPQHGVIYPSMKARRIMPVGRFHPMDSSAEEQQGLKMRRMRRFSWKICCDGMMQRQSQGNIVWWLLLLKWRCKAKNTGAGGAGRLFLVLVVKSQTCWHAILLDTMMMDAGSPGLQWLWSSLVQVQRYGIPKHTK